MANLDFCCLHEPEHKARACNKRERPTNNQNLEEPNNEQQIHDTSFTQVDQNPTTLYDTYYHQHVQQDLYKNEKIKAP